METGLNDSAYVLTYIDHVCLVPKVILEIRE